MDKSYTQEASQKCMRLMDAGMDSVWEDIDRTDEHTTSEKWAMKLQSIADEFFCSGRFGLMRILLSKAPENELLDPKNPTKGFSVNTTGGKRYQFRDITMEHAENLTQEELKEYEAVLRDIAAIQADADAVRDKKLIQNALRSTKKSSMLTRKNAFVLGHSLRLSYEEMQWFLLRAFEMGSGFRLHTSQDLIEAYGFKTGASASHVEKLKLEYEAKCGAIPKVFTDQKETNWTRSAGESLDQVDSWPEDCKDICFMEWMQTQAPYLDTNSATALRIYRNLLAYLLTAEREVLVPSLQKMRMDLIEILSWDSLSAAAEDCFLENGQISIQKCKNCADELLIMNKFYSDAKLENKALAYHVPAMKPSGNITMHNAQLNVPVGEQKTSSTIQQILMNQWPIEKEDMLYLLWQYAMMYGYQFPSYDIKEMLQSFISMAKILLGEAMLPAFYPPHLMEQSMMLAIVCGGLGYVQKPSASQAEKIRQWENDWGEKLPEPWKKSPGEVYEIICEACAAAK